MKLYKYNSDKLLYEPINLKNYIWLLLGLCVLFSSFGFTGAMKFNSFIEKIPVIIRLNQSEFSEENLKREMNRLNIKFPDVVYQQCVIEGASKTGKRWNNPIFIEGNNFLGLKKSFYRPSTAISWDKDYYCSYQNWRDCLLDYSIFQAQNCKNIHTEEEYYQFLNDLGYSINSNYVTNLKKIQ